MCIVDLQLFNFHSDLCCKIWFSMITPLVMCACTLHNTKDNSNIKSHHRCKIALNCTLISLTMCKKYTKNTNKFREVSKLRQLKACRLIFGK